MVLRNRIITTVIIFLLLSVLFSGCTGKKNIALTPAPDLIQTKTVNVSSQNLTHSSKEENTPEIKITSFSSVYMHDNSGNEDIYLFSWENVPGNESQRLLSFLKNEFHIDWVENAQISKTGNENKTIHVSRHNDLIEIMLNNESALLKIGDRGYYDLWVRKENGTHNLYDKIYRNKYDISERYYAAYNLSIKNNGSKTIDFKLKDLNLHEGDRTFNTTTLEPYDNPYYLQVLRDLQHENKLQDTTLFPGQSLDGSVAFHVNSLYNKSFLLKYNTTPVTSASFEKSIEALKAAEYFNYSAALGEPPYRNCNFGDGTKGSYEPMFDDYCDTWANWVNRSVFETYQRSDVERIRKTPPDNYIPMTEMIYALRVVPERNITMSPVTGRFNMPELLVMDDTGEIIINTSRIKGMAVLNDQTYTFKPDWMLNFSRMDIPNASVVQISFKGIFGWPMGTRFSYSDQDIILDKDLNIIVVRYYPVIMVS
ncbi:MAG: DUF4352 domain-containing protein [Candidatus Methanoperedens sp.]|nr:DUF4352 domain-containing protein [Candidatus Methanoperedens sp.]